MNAMHVMRHFHRMHSSHKTGGGKISMFKSIGMGFKQTREVVASKKYIVPLVQIDIARDRHVGLGMSMVGSTHNGHDCLVVNALRSRPDGSPGPAEEADVQIGDILVTVNGGTITDFA